LLFHIITSSQSAYLVAFISLLTLVPLFLSIYIGEAVTVEDEVVVINSIVLPHKILNVSVQDEIIL